jgi:hypothetical protein
MRCGAIVVRKNLEELLGGDAVLQDALPADPREQSLDARSAQLIACIRCAIAIHSEMFAAILEATPQPSAFLAEFLEDAGNRYLDFSELVRPTHQAKS